MLPSPVTFDVVYSPDAATEAAARFRDYRFKRYGPLMIGACIVNGIGLFAVLWFGAKPGAPSTLFIWFFVVLSPIWLLYEHFVWPRLYMAKLLRLLPSPGRVSVSAESISVMTRRRDAVLPWSRIKTVLETPSTFLLVLSPPFGFLFIPRAALPAEARDALRAKVP